MNVTDDKEATGRLHCVEMWCCLHWKNDSTKNKCPIVTTSCLRTFLYQNLHLMWRRWCNQVCRFFIICLIVSELQTSKLWHFLWSAFIARTTVPLLHCDFSLAMQWRDLLMNDGEYEYLAQWLAGEEILLLFQIFIFIL